jgi:hypothetical protein
MQHLKRYISQITHRLATAATHSYYACSGRVAGILRDAAPGGFKRGLQHDCHEALTYILSLAHEEEMKLLKRRQHGSKSDADDKTMERHGVVARNFGIEEHVALTVRIHHHLFCESMVYCICLSNIFGSAAIALTCARSSTSVSSSLFPWVPLPHLKTSVLKACSLRVPMQRPSKPRAANAGVQLLTLEDHMLLWVRM